MKERRCVMWFRSFVVWVVLALHMAVHGALRELLMTPLVGEFAARQFSVLTGSAVVFLATYLFVRWIGARSTAQLLTVGSVWLALTVLFEVLLMLLFSPLWAARPRRFATESAPTSSDPHAESLRSPGAQR
jgi:hypothetical protein